MRISLFFVFMTVERVGSETIEMLVVAPSRSNNTRTRSQ